MQLFHFQNTTIDSDILNNAGKVTTYKDVFCCAESEEAARQKSKLSEEYTLVKVKQLSKDW